MIFKKNLLLILTLLPFLVACEMGGVQLTKSVVFCELENKVYRQGERVPAGDGCNFCTCSSTGKVENCTEINCEEPQQSSTTGTGLANPAAVKCLADGYRYEIREDSDGGQFGVCIDSNSKECDGWAYFREECLLGDIVQKFTAEMEAVAGFSGSGEVVVKFSAEKFTLTLSARDLPELSELEFYKGWLTRMESFNQISLGKLVPKEEEGAFVLSLETPENLIDHVRVSVTLENGESSETILEGVLEKVQ